MPYFKTTALKKIAKMEKRYRFISGGTSASKTISVLQLLIAMAQSDKTPTLTSIVSESFPHLKRGAIRDFKNIMQEHGYWIDDRWNATDYTYTFETGSKIEFFSADQPGKVRGPRRDRLFCNELNNIGQEAFEQLAVRTKEFIIADWNPVAEFYAYTEYIGKRDDVEFLVLTYKDNEALSSEIVREIESRRHNKNWWMVYGLGQLGEAEGRIYTDWQIIDEIPHEAQLTRRGLDFGFTNDPATIVDVYRYNGGYIVSERLYRKGMHNNELAAFLNNLDYPSTVVMADSAEPKSVAEIAMYNVPIIGVDKKGVQGQSYLKHSIDYVQQQRISVTKNSTNLIREYRNYLWMTDKDGKIINEPTSGNDHCFAPETLIYTTEGKKMIKDLVGGSGYLYSRNGTVQRFHGARITRQDVEVLDITFNDGKVLSITPDHLLLLADGTWKEARLLRSEDMIQSVTYGSNNYKRTYKKVQQLQLSEKAKWLLRKIGRETFQKFTQRSVEVSLWRDTARLSYTSHRPQPRKQSDRKLRDCTFCTTLERPYDTRTQGKNARTRRKNKTASKSMALVTRGDRVAQVTWQEDMGKPRTHIERMRSLPQTIRDARQKQKYKVLPSELQNESPTKTIARVTRRRCSVVYNLEVENTHCLYVGGVIAHNCLDALRYAFDGLRPQEDDDDGPTFSGNVTNLFY